MFAFGANLPCTFPAAYLAFLSVRTCNNLELSKFFYVVESHNGYILRSNNRFFLKYSLKVYWSWVSKSDPQNWIECWWATLG